MAKDKVEPLTPEEMLAGLQEQCAKLMKELARMEGERDLIHTQFRNERERCSMLEKRLAEAKISTISVESQCDPDLMVELADTLLQKHPNSVAKIFKYEGSNGTLQQAPPYIDEQNYVHYLLPKHVAEESFRGNADRYVLVAPLQLTVHIKGNREVKTFEANLDIKNILRKR